MRATAGRRWPYSMLLRSTPREKAEESCASLIHRRACGLKPLDINKLHVATALAASAAYCVGERHSPPPRGGEDAAQENFAKPPYCRRRGGRECRKLSACSTTPSAPLRRLRGFLFMSRPPLLGEEGNALSVLLRPASTYPNKRSGYKLPPQQSRRLS